MANDVTVFYYKKVEIKKLITQNLKIKNKYITSYLLLHNKLI